MIGSTPDRTHPKALVVVIAGAIKCLALLLLCIHRSAGQGPSGEHCQLSICLPFCCKAWQMCTSLCFQMRQGMECCRPANLSLNTQVCIGPHYCVLK